MPGHVHPSSAPSGPSAVPAYRLIAVLGGAGALAGALIVLAYHLTLPAIEAHRAKVLNAAIVEVLAHPARYDTLYLADGKVTPAPPSGGSAPDQRVYRGFDGDGRLVGYAIVAQAPGFQDVVRLIFGWDPDQGTLLGMKVLESKETPGLGERIESDTAFVRQFGGKATPIVGVKKGKGTGDSHEIDMLTGATISSRTVIKIIDDALARMAEPLRAATTEAGR
jgi:H+/Na+-translocating ferredoxin:NAD+ oxidoreductase subunit G